MRAWSRVAGLATVMVMSLATLMLLLMGAGCTRDDDAVRAEVQRLVLAEGDDALAQAERLSRHGRRALTSIEAVLHTADEPGRKNLVVAMRRLGDEEAVPLLMHVAVYDAGASVRREAEWTLRSWAQDPAGGARADKARQAIRRLEELKQREAAG